MAQNEPRKQLYGVVAYGDSLTVTDRYTYHLTFDFFSRKFISTVISTLCKG